MAYFLLALGLVLSFEGLLYAAFPNFAKKLADAALKTDAYSLRLAGVCCLALGVFTIWLSKQL